MYERNAIILERYFNEMFGYNTKSNIKNNFTNYSELVECLEKYRNISEEEDTIMQEYDMIANEIRGIQKTQENLNKKNNKLQEDRAEIFQNIDESAEEIQKKIDTINSNIQRINIDIEENANNFVKVIAEFNDKSVIRTKCGRSRREIESEYNKRLKETMENYEKIDVNLEKKAKQFKELETEDIEKELQDRIEKNGEKEKIPFNKEVVVKAIAICIDIQKRETEILTTVYDKTNKLFSEIKNNLVKIEKHKKIIRDSKSKLEFVSAIKEYLVQFLDNERLTAVNGEEEHDKLMKDACINLDEDLVQINNLYTLLLKEISKKITKKSYSELYNFEYLKELENKSEEFDKQIKKLKLPVTIINPNYWRIEGMRKIYDIFYNCVTEVYGRDLSEYMPVENIEEEYDEEKDEDFEEEMVEEIEEPKKATNTKKTKSKNEKQEEKEEIDKQVDMILGFSDEEDDDDDDEEFDNDDWDDEEFDNDDWDDEDEEDDDWDEEEELEEDNEDEEYEDNDDDWIEDDDEEEEDDDDDWEEDDDDWDDEEDDDSYEDMDTNNKKAKNEYEEESWENEFINLNKKGSKKKNFFDKFKK